MMITATQLTSLTGVAGLPAPVPAVRFRQG